MMKTLFFCFALSVISSCTIPKESRTIKRQSKTRKDVPVLLEAYLDAPYSGTFLTFYENLEFELKSTGILRLFESGTYQIDQDTINLSYKNLEKKIYKTEKVIIDIDSNFLIYQNSKGLENTRFRILSNKLKK